MTSNRTREISLTPIERRLRHRGSGNLTELQISRRRKVIDRLEVVDERTWRWTGQAKTARGRRYPQIALTLGGGATQLLNARHVVFYLATGWVHEAVQQYRSRDGDPMNVHPDNLAPTPPISSARANNNLWDTDRLRDYFG